MASARRNTIQINLVKVSLQLKDLALRVLDGSHFTRKHGQLLNLVTAKPDEELLKVLFQFFGPVHHCFTFPDYQLVPTMEEFSQLLGVPILDQLPFNGTEEHPKPEEIARALSLQRSYVVANWETKRGVKGFWLSSCLRKLIIFGIPRTYKIF